MFVVADMCLIFCILGRCLEIPVDRRCPRCEHNLVVFPCIPVDMTNLVLVCRVQPCNWGMSRRFLVDSPVSNRACSLVVGRRFLVGNAVKV